VRCEGHAHYYLSNENLFDRGKVWVPIHSAVSHEIANGNCVWDESCPDKRRGPSTMKLWKEEISTVFGTKH